MTEKSKRERCCFECCRRPFEARLRVLFDVKQKRNSCKRCFLVVVVVVVGMINFGYNSILLLYYTLY